jgi:hypothetical protein
VIRETIAATYVIKGNTNTLGIALVDKTEQLLDRDLGDGDKVAPVITEICINTYGTVMTVDMPGTEMHGLEDELVLDAVLLYLVKIAELALKSATCPTLKKQHNDKRNEKHDADSPQHRDEILVLCLGIE